MTKILIELPIPMTQEAAQLAIRTIGQLCGPQLMQELASSLKGSVAIPPAPGAEDDNTGETITGDRDKTGLLWDERIHAGSKKANADGSWKKRKGVDAATVTAVEAELRAKGGNLELPAFLDRTKNPIPPAPTPIPTAPTPIPPAPAAVVLTYPGIMSRVGTMINGKKLTMGEFQTMLTDNGLSIATLKDAPHMFEVLSAQLDAKG